MKASLKNETTWFFLVANLATQPACLPVCLPPSLAPFLPFFLPAQLTTCVQELLTNLRQVLPENVNVGDFLMCWLLQGSCKSISPSQSHITCLEEAKLMSLSPIVGHMRKLGHRSVKGLAQAFAVN